MRNSVQRSVTRSVYRIALYVIFIAGTARGAVGEMHKVSIDLPGGIDQVVGINVRKDPQGMGHGDLLEPQQVVLTLPDSRKLLISARSSTVTLNLGTIDMVVVRRPLQPLKFLEAKADLLRTMSELGIEPDALMRGDLSTWSTDSAGFDAISGKGFIPYDYKTAIRTPFHGMLLDFRISADPGGGWYYLMIFTPMTKVSVEAIYPASQPSGAPTSSPVPAAVKIPGPAADVLGIDADIPHVGFGEADALNPRDLTIHCSDGTNLQLSARSVHLMCFDQVVEAVYLRGPMVPVDFAEAKAELLKMVRGLGIEPNSDRVMKEMIADWRDWASPAMEPFIHKSEGAALGVPFHGLCVTIRLCPYDNSKWYYYLIFAPKKDPLEELKKLQAFQKKSATSTAPDHRPN